MGVRWIFRDFLKTPQHLTIYTGVALAKPHFVLSIHREETMTTLLAPRAAPTAAAASNLGGLSSETFTKAALYQQCRKSTILKHIDLKNVDVSVMRDLINKENILNLRKLPVIFSKFVVKMALEFTCDKFPKAGKFIQPSQIRVDVEDDEMEFLLASTNKFKPSLVFIVSKNILISVLGDSVESLRTKLVNHVQNKSGDEDAEEVGSIPIDVPKTEAPKSQPPKDFTGILGEPLSPRSSDIKPLKRLNTTSPLRTINQDQLSRRSSRASSVASSALSSVMSSKNNRRNQRSNRRHSRSSNASSNSSIASSQNDNNDKPLDPIDMSRVAAAVNDDKLMSEFLDATDKWQTANKLLNHRPYDYYHNKEEKPLHNFRRENSTDKPHKEPLIIQENIVLSTLNDVIAEAPEDMADGSKMTKDDSRGSSSTHSKEFSLPMDDDDDEPNANSEYGDDDKPIATEPDVVIASPPPPQQQQPQATNSKAIDSDCYEIMEDDDYDDDGNNTNIEDDSDVDMDPEPESMRHISSMNHLQTTQLKPKAATNMNTFLDLVTVQPDEFSFVDQTPVVPRETIVLSKNQPQTIITKLVPIAPKPQTFKKTSTMPAAVAQAAMSSASSSSVTPSVKNYNDDFGF